MEFKKSEEKGIIVYLCYAGLNFQVCFILNSNCGDYVQSETMAKTSDITNQLSVGVEHLCGCGFNSSLLADQFIRYFPEDSPSTCDIQSCSHWNTHPLHGGAGLPCQPVDQRQ